ncbi:MAG: ATP-dependent helicase [Deltaproteobacteria bacterium]|nr:ATP-dependent helicase [Deltaproteobacteria bacterium]
MTIAPALLREYPAMNDAQRMVVAHGDGPLLVIAGPGSGKTFSLVLRAINLLLLGKATPHELVICTFTEKAALELRDRIAAAARKVDYNGDLSELRVGTIHGLCNRLLSEHRHHTPLGNNYETLYELTQLLFIFEHFNEIIGPETNGQYLGRWGSRWTAIEGARAYFDKITEELVDAEQLQQNRDPALQQIGKAYLAYRQALFTNNRLDFAHLQKLLHDLLLDAEVGPAISRRVKYVLVDEYQDTNFIQEQILLKLSVTTGNLCVVGDEDQSLYRFRGATVRNILEFPARFADCMVVKLTTNYRSHNRIVEAYDRWMASANWSNPHGLPFRYDKTIQPDLDIEHPNYPAIFSIWGNNERDEAGRFAELVNFLKESKVIQDYSQVALLLHSVRSEHSGPYLAALEAKGIRVFCPRARAYFDNDEVRLMVGCLAVIFGYYGEGRGAINGPALQNLARYVDGCIVELGRSYGTPHPLASVLQDFVAGIANLKKDESLDLRPADYFYRLLACEPFVSFVKNENRARNLAILSQLINTFQNYYHYNIVTFGNRERLRFHLFNSFLRLLHEGGINEYEDPEQPFPKGYVQVMTIHQSKGLEFPVVVVGSLDKQLSTNKGIDRDLQPYYQRPPFEPENRITLFDRMRLHYVAFSRAEKILVLTSDEQPKDHFAPIWQGLPQWPYVRKELLAAQRFQPKDRMPVKRAFSFTGDLKVYETCPRQYQFFREYDFTPSRSATIFFGLLVHQTIEEIHRIVLDGKLATLNEVRIRTLFERTFSFLTLADVRPIGHTAKESAFQQVMNYFRQNQDDMRRVIETEVDVSVEKDDYILTGKIDLLMGGDGKLELLDFKTAERPVNSPQLLAAYERQLCTYAHILEQRYGKRPDRLLLYWTAEPRKTDALMEFPYRPELVDEAGYFREGTIKLREGDL